MTVLEQRYMTIMTKRMPSLIAKVEKLNDNVERLIKLLEDENCKS